MFKKTVMAGLVAAALGSGLAQAQQSASPHELTGNIGLYSQYIFRGLTQTNGEPALQGGFDYSHSSGFYLGTWGSNISWLRDGGAYRAGGSGEFDFYGGYKWDLAKDVTLDLGTLYYWYPGDATLAAPGAPANPKADTWEVYAGLGWKWLTGKFSYSVNNKTFAVLDSKGTYYFDLTASVPVTKELSLIAHWGRQKFTGQDPRLIGVATNDQACSYEDWKLGLSYSLPKNFTIGVFYTDTSGANSLCYGSVNDVPAGAYPKNVARGTGTVYISKTF